jgi:hypothetical protein
MRKLMFAVLLFVSTFSFAQSGVKEDIAVIQSLYGKSKQELVSAYMDLKEPQASAFSKVYEAYESERKALGEKRMMLIADYANNFTTLTDEKADELAKATLKNNMEYEKLYMKYYTKSKAVLGAVNAAKFIQLENALHTAVRSETQDAIPFIGEIDRSKKH